MYALIISLDESDSVIISSFRDKLENRMSDFIMSFIDRWGPKSDDKEFIDGINLIKDYIKDRDIDSAAEVFEDLVAEIEDKIVSMRIVPANLELDS